MSSNFDQVKRAFAELALEHHPDRTRGGSADEFVRIRRAFEAIRNHVQQQQQQQQDNGHGNNNVGSYPACWSAEEIQNWFHEETGDFLNFEMSHSTRSEVIQAFKDLGPPSCGRGTGGYWEMARLLAEQDEHRRSIRTGDGGEEEPMKLLSTNNTADDSNMRRRRKR